MNNFMTQLVVLMLLVLIGLCIWRLFLSSMIKLPKKKEEKEKVIDESSVQNAKHTNIMNFWEIQYYSSRGIKTVPLVFRPGHSEFSIGIDPSCDLVIEDAHYVSHIHAKIYKDKDGYFLQDYSLNGIYDSDCHRQEEISIEDGTVVQLADAKIRFSRNDPFRAEQEESIPKRRHPVGEQQNIDLNATKLFDFMKRRTKNGED